MFWTDMMLLTIVGYELIAELDSWNKENKNVRKREPGSGEYRDFVMPVVSTVFPYWLAKDANNGWWVCTSLKISLSILVSANAKGVDQGRLAAQQDVISCDG